MVKLAIAGLGTVGAGVVKLLLQNAGLIAARAGQPVVLQAINARNRTKARNCDISGIDWVDNPLALAARADIDIVVELIGGADGMAYELAKATLATGKKLVTANKALLATHGLELAALAERHRTYIAYEAAVAGTIPVIKALREGMAGNRVNAVRGILNGTCNFILTRMRTTGATFADALREAQHLGFAEADPSADIDGHDTANKLALLAAIAFGVAPDVKAIKIEGITRISQLDLQFAAELGYRIKLLGVARMSEAGLEQRVGPCLVPTTLSLAHVQGALNAVSLCGDFAGDVMLEGQGAGSLPTASAVVADIIDLARGLALPTFGIPVSQLQSVKPIAEGGKARYYLRFEAMDKPGVVADISATLRDEAISIASLIQHGTSATQSVPVVITTHYARHDAMRRVVDKIAVLSTIVERPCLIHIED
jgi:homoserine dehydrogenase